MTTPFTIATQNPTLSKVDQLAAWLEFSVLLEALKNVGLEFNAESVQKLEAIAPTKKHIIHKALKARDKLVFTNQALVIRLAERYANSIIDLSDLIQYGNIGLMKALVKFKPRKNAKFSSYAYFWIKATIFEALYRVDPIYIPAKVRKEMQTFTFAPLQEEDRTNEIADSDRVTSSTVNDLMINLTEQEQDTLSDAFGLEGNTTILTVALLAGISFEEAVEKVNDSLTKLREAA